jgi:HEAT repeat protein
MSDALRNAIDRDQVRDIVDELTSLEPDGVADAVDLLIELADHRAYPVREAVARRLGEVACERAFPALVRLTQEEHEADRHVRRAAVNAVSNYAGAEATAALDSATCDSALNVRADAETALAARTAQNQNEGH